MVSSFGSESGAKFGEQERCSFHTNFHFTHILKSSVNNYCTDPREQEIYSFYKITSKILLRWCKKCVCLPIEHN